MSQRDLFATPLPRPARVESATRRAPQAPAHEAFVSAESSGPREETPSGPLLLSVSALTAQLKGRVEAGFSSVLVRGQVSNYRGPNASGHLYFSLKDDAASLDVKMWKFKAARLGFHLEEGMDVIVAGALQIYAPQGRYSLIAERIEPEGKGALALAFEQLRKRLEAQGLIGPNKTRPLQPLPLLPRRVGIATSRTGAALQDFIHVARRRCPGAALLVADCRVQGEGAALDIARAIRWRGPHVDVVVVARGGGSAEDLWAFNEAPVVEAIAACPVPIVSAIGHEIDVTLADGAADVRAPTPSVAAELVLPVTEDLRLTLAEQRQRMQRALWASLKAARLALKASRHALGDGRQGMTRARLELADRAERLRSAVHRQMAEERRRWTWLARRHAAGNPTQALVERRKQLQRLRSGLERATPLHGLRAARGSLAQQRQTLTAALREQLSRHRQTLVSLSASLDALSPLAVLARGYALVYRQPDGRLLRAGDPAPGGMRLDIRLAGDRRIAAQVVAQEET